MAQDSFQAQRFELKYFVDERITAEMREFVRCYLELDDYGVGQANFAYPVHSLYLDSDGLHTYHDTINGAKNRFKIRLRYYDNHPETPVFFEVKARVDYCILKQRCGVRRDAVPLLLAGQLPEPEHLLSREPRHLAAIQRFHELQLKLNARPKLHNRYSREAWVSPHDNSVRVTFDRNVHVEPFFQTEAVTEMTNPLHVYKENCILEIKFTNRFPDWLRELVRSFNLMRSAAAKYVGGVLFLGEYRFHDGEKGLDWQGLTPHEWEGILPAPDAAAQQEAIELV
jgi:SPX domain protein involved in polyphosphate accumulation